MKYSNKKLIAPIVITILLVIYLGTFLFACFYISVPIVWKIIGSLIPLALISVSIYVLIERIKEIRSGEEDDLSKY
ncbi:uncharacterized protein (DUF983 family) [Sedimentibacter acidaminivorans]|jgi:uncharacterized protein (DUF983 family)|uniref:Uncharacterized protein (DUF983 family) n=1 Tax=Sedimentibacter acidaminivorans TaxID=913099 RepID=A0ABS4GCV0_9FIRM|nr:hypothetical protein [Sedimentibacter acidaminivorans]MBP1925362.1 uncharacterized protein (DUF983 family) [Sedimentibacter acidaminivorans]